MPTPSAGLLMFRKRLGVLEFLLVHPGGPFFRKKDEGVWTIPKGQVEPGEALLDTAQREFLEETGSAATPPFIALTPIKQKGGKVVHAWAFEGDLDPANITSNTFTIEWPPRSKKFVEFPEIDRAGFFDAGVARMKINAAQVPLLDELTAIQKAAGEIPA